MNRTFKVRYTLSHLQTRNNPLFTRIKAFLMVEGSKQIIAQSKQFKNNRVDFKTTIEEPLKVLTIHTNSNQFEDSKVLLLFEFQSQGCYIKMGESVINLATVMNSKLQGKLLSYNVEKCYDRNAKIWVQVQLLGIEDLRLNKSTQIRSRDDAHVRSHSQFVPTKGRVRSIYESINDCTQNSILQNEAFKQDYSMLTENKARCYPRLNHDKLTIEKTEFGQKATLKNEEMQNLQQKLVDSTTDLRIARQQLVAVQKNYVEAMQNKESLVHKLSDAQNQITKLTDRCSDLESQLGTLLKSEEMKKQQSGSEASKYMKLFQESEKTKNKLLVEAQSAQEQKKEKIAELSKKVNELQNQMKQIQRSEQLMKSDKEHYQKEKVAVQKAYKLQKKQRSKVEDQLRQLKVKLEGVMCENDSLKSELDDLKAKNISVEDELQMCRFGMNEQEQELSQLKREFESNKELMSQYEGELQLCNQALNTERKRYNHKLQEIQMQTERQNQNMDKYIEELETKTICQNTKSSQVSQLKRQLARLRRDLDEQQQKNYILEEQVSAKREEIYKLQMKIAHEKMQTIEIAKHKGKIESQLIRMESEFDELRLYKKGQNQQNPCALELSEQQRQIFREKCFEQRDDYWQREIQKIDKDTRQLIEKQKRQKETINDRLRLVTKNLSAKDQQNIQLTNKNGLLSENIQKLQTQIKVLQSSIKDLQKKLVSAQTQLLTKQTAIESLNRKNQNMEQLEGCLVDCQKKMIIKSKQFSALRSELQKQKQLKPRITIQIKQIMSSIAYFLNKSQKNKIFFEPIRSCHIDQQVTNIVNETLKVYCEKHNRIRQKLQKIVQLESQLQQKEVKLNKSLNSKRKISNTSKTGKKDFFEEQNFLLTYNSNSVSDCILGASFEQDGMSALIRQQNCQLKSKCDKFKSRINELQKLVEGSQISVEQIQSENNKLSRELERRLEQLELQQQKLRSKEKQLDNAREENRNISSELINCKNQLEQTVRMLKLEKNQSHSRKGSFSKTLPVKTNDDTYLRLAELQKKLKFSEEQIDRLKKQKQERRKEEGPAGKQLKQCQLRLKEKQAIILNLKKELEEERQNQQQQKQLNQIRMKKMKQAHQEEIEVYVKEMREVKQQLTIEEQKGRQPIKKMKNLEQTIKSLNVQLLGLTEREQKCKRMLNSEWELKTKGIQTQHDNQISIHKRQLEEQRSIQKSLREIISKKEKQMNDLSEEIQKKSKDMENLMAQCQLYGIRIKNLQQEEDAYKETIGVLEKKMMMDSTEGLGKRSGDRQRESCELKSNVSLKAFSFR